MYNVLKEVPSMSKLVQVGIRDYCDEELMIIRENPDRVATYFDKDIKEQQYEGATWKQICQNTIWQSFADWQSAARGTRS